MIPCPDAVSSQAVPLFYDGRVRSPLHRGQTPLPVWRSFPKSRKIPDPIIPRLISPAFRTGEGGKSTKRIDFRRDALDPAPASNLKGCP
jgi:hypothetical protein